MNRAIATTVALAVSLAAFTGCCGESVDKLADRVFDTAISQYKEMDASLSEGMLPRTFENGKLVESGSGWWCSGFYPGTLWYIYHYTQDPAFAAMAESNTAKVLPEAYKSVTHDIGFMINCSFGNGLRLGGHDEYAPVLEAAAGNLAKRYLPTTHTTRSWNGGGPDGTWLFPVIVDNMMNLELLMEVWKRTGTDSLKTIALDHANTTMANQYRDDFTAWHVVDYDPSDGHVRSKVTHQGFSDDSAWARGQAWGLYGYTMMYKETGDKTYLDQALKIGNMLISRLPEDGIPYWDFNDPAIPSTLKDASAGAIMASAFADLGRLAPGADGKRCLKMAKKQVRTLGSPRYLAEKGENGHFILKHSVGSLPGKSEIDVPLTYADYYFIEALLRLTGRLD